MALRMKAIVAGDKSLRHIKQVRAEWIAALGSEGNAIRDSYLRTTKTWKHRQEIAFQTRANFGPVQWWIEVWTSHRIYWFVHEGLGKGQLRAIFSNDKDDAGRWYPKTQPRVLNSGRGSGRVYIRPYVRRDSYKPREFTEAIIEYRQKRFQKAMEKATRDGVKNIP